METIKELYNNIKKRYEYTNEIENAAIIITTVMAASVIAYGAMLVNFMVGVFAG